MEKTKSFLKKNFLCFFFMVVTVFVFPLFVGCNNNGVGLDDISFTDSTYAVYQGRTVQLEVKFQPENATNKALRWTVTNGLEYISVDQNGLVTAKATGALTTVTATVTVVSDYKGYIKSCNVVVYPRQITLAAPTNVHYDASTSSVVWDSVIFSDNGYSYEPNYVLKINKDGQSSEVSMNKTKSYKIEEAGNYEVQVKAVSDIKSGEGEERESLFEDSDYSEITTNSSFEILSSPNNIRVFDSKIVAEELDKEGVVYDLSIYEKISGQEISDEKYELLGLTKNPQTSLWTISTRTINVEIPDEFFSDGLSKVYELKIRSRSTQAQVFNSVYSDLVAFSKLSVPTNLKVKPTDNGNVLSWNAVENAIKYRVFVIETDNDEETILEMKTLSGTSIAFSEFSTNLTSNQNLHLKVQALGTDDLESGSTISIYRINSSVSEKVQEYTLPSVTNFRVEQNESDNLILKWTKLEEASVYYRITLNGMNSYSTAVGDEVKEIPLSYLSEGENLVSIVAVDNAGKLDSDPTYLDEKVVKLGQITIQTKNGAVAWNSVDNAKSYEISIYDSTKTLKKSVTIADEDSDHFDGEKYIYSFKDGFYDVNDVFAAGNYYIVVRPKGDGIYVRNADVTSVDDAPYFVKQEKPTVQSLSSEGTLSWTGSAGSNFKVVVYGKDQSGISHEVKTILTSSKSVDVSDYLKSYKEESGNASGYNEYLFEITAINDVSTFNYLNSEFSLATTVKLSLPQNFKISSGKFVWDEFNMSLNETLVDEIKEIVGYEIVFANTRKKQIDDYRTTSLEPESGLMGSGERCSVSIKYYIKAESSNRIVLDAGTATEKTLFVVESDMFTKDFTRLRSPTSPYVENDSSSSNDQKLVLRTDVPNCTKYKLVLYYYNGTNWTYNANFSEEQTVAEDTPYWTTATSTLFEDFKTAGNYEIRAIALGGDDYINSKESSSGCAICRLESPTPRVSNGVLVWNEVYSNLNGVKEPIEQYQVGIRPEGSSGTFDIQERGTGTSWDMEGIEPGKYEIIIISAGIGGSILSSSDDPEDHLINNKLPVFEKVGSIEEEKDDPNDDTEVPHIVRVLKASEVHSGDYNWNGIKWTEVSGQNIRYRLQIYQVLQDETLKYDSEVDLNQFVFPQEFNASRYCVVIQAVKAGAINGDKTDKIYINRLSSVSGIDVSGTQTLKTVQNTLLKQNYTLSWNPVANAAGYSINIDGKEHRTRTVSASQGTSIYLIDEEHTDTSLRKTDTGSMTITIIANIDSENLLPDENGELTISAPKSYSFNIYRNETPNIFMNNGQLSWTRDRNSVNYGYLLVFNPVENGLTVFVDIDPCVTTYDMNDENLTGTYNVSVIAIGSKGSILQSAVKDFETSDHILVNVKRLPMLDSESDIRVVNGEICWDYEENVVSYKAVASNSALTVTTPGIKKSSGTSIVKLPKDAIKGINGQINLTVQAMGTLSTSGSEEEVFVNSKVSGQFVVTKLATPTGLMIKDGEIQWLREKATNQGTHIVSGYNVIYGSNIEKLDMLNGSGQYTNYISSDEYVNFILSEKIGIHQTIGIQVCAIGNENGGSGSYISSEYTDVMYVEIAGKPISLTVEDGVLRWSEYADTNSYDDYELLLYEEGDDNEENPITILSSSRTNDLSDPSLNVNRFKSIKVRHIGTEDSSVTSSRKVNSQYSEDLLNIIKLPDIGQGNVFVDDSGNLNWSYDSAYDPDESIVGIKLLVEGVLVESTTEREGINLISSSIKQEIERIGYSHMDIDFYAYAVNNTRTDPEHEYLYVQSGTNSVEAIKFGELKTLNVVDGLKLSWTMDSSSYAFGEGNNKKIVKNDKIVIMYYYSPNLEDLGKDETYGEKEISISDAMVSYESGETIYSIPLWKLGYYSFSASVISSSDSMFVLRSQPKVLITDEEETTILFNKFESGRGTIENPFVISTTSGDEIDNEIGAEQEWRVEISSATDKFNYIKSIPVCYFRLEDDIELPDYEEDKAVSNNFVVDTNYYNFLGGINGRGTDENETIHTIRNYKVYNSLYSPLFNVIEGKDVRDTLGTSNLNESNFYGRSGIIMNLKLEISEFNYYLGTTSVSFFASTMVGGWIANCEISLSSSFINNSEASDCIDIEDNTNNEILFGSFVGEMYATMPYSEGPNILPSTKTNSYRNTTIINCVSNLNVRVLRSLRGVSDIEVVSATRTVVSGIAGHCKGCNIYNSRNRGKLEGTQVAGITAESDSMTVYETEGRKTASSVVSGCLNEGSLTAYPINSNGTHIRSDSGGIIGTAHNTYIVNCINFGEMNAIASEIMWGIDNSSADDVCMGGIVAGFSMDNINGNYHEFIKNCFNFGKMMDEEKCQGLAEYTNIARPHVVGGIVGTLMPIGESSIYPITSYFDTDVCGRTIILNNDVDHPVKVIPAVGNQTTINGAKTTQELQVEQQNIVITDIDHLIDTKVELNYYYYSSVYKIKPVFNFELGQYPTLSYVNAS